MSVSTPKTVYIMALNAQKPNDHKPPVQSEVADDIEALNNAAKKRNEVGSGIYNRIILT